MPPNAASYSGALGALIVRKAKLNTIANGTDSAGSNADLQLTCSKDFYINASTGTGSNLTPNNINVIGNLLTSTGTFGSDSNASGLTLTTAVGDINFAPAGKVNLTGEIALANGTLTAAGDMTLVPTNDLKLDPGSGKVDSSGTLSSTNSTATLTGDGVPTRIVSSTGQDIQLRPVSGQSVTTDAPIVTSDTHVTGTTALVLGAQSGNVTLAPTSGNVILTPGGSNAVIKMSSDVLLSAQNVVGSNASGVLINAAAGDLGLTSSGSIIANSLFKTSQGTIQSTASNLELNTSGQGDIRLYPGGSNANVAIGAVGAGTSTVLQVNGGAITGSKSTVLSTTSGDLTLTSAANIVVTSPIVTSAGAITASGTDLTLSAPSGHKVVIDGDLDVTGTVTHVNSTDLLVEDKTVTLAHSDSPGALATVDGAGIVIDNSDTDVSLRFNDNAGVPFWALNGGDFRFQKTFVFNGTTRMVGYELSIDPESENLVFSNECKEDEMIDLTQPRCSCGEIAYYALAGGEAVCCRGCMTPDMVHTRKHTCVVGSCEPIKSVRFANTACYECSGKVPQKMWERKVVKELKRLGIEYSYYDVSVPCSQAKGIKAFRPDLIFALQDFVVILEVDENEHRAYELSCEVGRVGDIKDAIELPLLLIRLNPSEARIKALGETMKWAFSMGEAVKAQEAGLMLAYHGYSDSRRAELHEQMVRQNGFAYETIVL
ncbi:hypothetical protein KFL_006340210 [Klebsormidium nitens]|uniref:Uncharacterized protein n=1 Tax=Klebsormidium nitens TaxID=105231 RepID=A0A1Y1II68_KLENI|nr:hypothetical protein KFL_006340210 [Klebsormidium nitens]|eukprot:GAQ90403.1 hypothetical protein KFL_006340210 [Klebsormidium nitens]